MLSYTFCLHIKGKGGKSQASNMTKKAGNNMKSVALHNLGCKVNAYELEVIGQKLQESGYMIVPFDDKADIDDLINSVLTSKSEITIFTSGEEAEPGCGGGCCGVLCADGEGRGSVGREY